MAKRTHAKDADNNGTDRIVRARLLHGVGQQLECAWCGKTNGAAHWYKGCYCSEFCQQQGSTQKVKYQGEM